MFVVDIVFVVEVVFVEVVFVFVFVFVVFVFELSCEYLFNFYDVIIVEIWDMLNVC